MLRDFFLINYCLWLLKLNSFIHSYKCGLHLLICFHNQLFELQTQESLHTYIVTYTMQGSYSIDYLAPNILLIILLFTLSINSITALQKTSVEFIRTSCSLTTYPTLCFNSLSTRAGDIQTNPKLLAQTALSVTLDTTRTTSSTIVKMSQVRGMTPREVSAMKDCIELLNDSVYELKRSLDEMSRPGSKDRGLVMSDIQTWVSSALTDEDTCSEGFASDPNMKSVVRGKIVNVVHLTSNALSLINSYASLHGLFI